MVPLMFKVSNYVQAMKYSVVLRKTKLHSQGLFYIFYNCDCMTLCVCDFITSLTLNTLEA